MYYLQNYKMYYLTMNFMHMQVVTQLKRGSNLCMFYTKNYTNKTKVLLLDQSFCAQISSRITAVIG